MRRFKHYGYAIVTFGRPVSVDEFVRAHPDVLAQSFDDRKAALMQLAEKIMDEISDAIPVTPVTLVATILSEPHTDEEIIAALRTWESSEAIRRAPPLKQGDEDMVHAP